VKQNPRCRVAVHGAAAGFPVSSRQARRSMLHRAGHSRLNAPSCRL